MTESVKHLERKVSIFWDDINKLQNGNEEVIGRFGKGKTVLRKRVVKESESVPTRHFKTMMYVSSTIKK